MGNMQESEGWVERCFQFSFLNCVINSQNPPILGGGLLAGGWEGYSVMST